MSSHPRGTYMRSDGSLTVVADGYEFELRATEVLPIVVVAGGSMNPDCNSLSALGYTFVAW